jgi:hypothetical protein
MRVNIGSLKYSRKFLHIRWKPKKISDIYVFVLIIGYTKLLKNIPNILRALDLYQFIHPPKNANVSDIIIFDILYTRFYGVRRMMSVPYFMIARYIKPVSSGRDYLYPPRLRQLIMRFNGITDLPQYAE